MSSRLIAALLAGTLLPLSLAAQQPKGTAQPERFERQREVRAKIEGLTAAETREWIQHIDRIGEILAANPAVNAPPDGVCTRLRIWVNQYTHARRYPVDEVAVALPVLYDDVKGCSRISNSGVKVVLNDPLSLLRFDGSINTDNVHDAEGAITVMARVGTGPGGRPVYRHNGDRMVILTRGTEPLLVPVSRERFLRTRITEAERALGTVAAIPTAPLVDVERWLREDRPRMVAEHQEMLRRMEKSAPKEQIEKMRQQFADHLARTEAGLRQLEARQPDAAAYKATAMGTAGSELDALRAALAALSPAERSAPACADINSWPTMLGACNDYNRYMALNPRYFDPSVPKSAVQLIVVRTQDGTSNKENRSHADVRSRIFETLDYAALEAVLH